MSISIFIVTRKGQTALVDGHPENSPNKSLRQVQPHISSVFQPTNFVVLEWATETLEASRTISFEEFVVTQLSKQTTHFWFPVEETLHSARYIELNERPVIQFWGSVIDKRKRESLPCHVLDIGSNGGYFSLFSRAMGCNVMAVDAQPRCLVRLNSAAGVNGFSSGLTTQWTAVSDNKNLTVRVGATKCSGLWAVKESEWINQESSKTILVSSKTAVDIVSAWIPSMEIITLMKIDAEGSELSILRSALPLFQSHRVLHLIAEFVPDRVKGVSTFEDVSNTLEVLYASNYRCFQNIFQEVSPGAQGSTSLKDIIYYFNPANLAAGRSNPEMWRCSLMV
jgi:FkbM family methyltransferase